ncbi:hypothetical protein PQQ69_38680 [Paraburkholderia aromaticivorans]
MKSQQPADSPDALLCPLQGCAHPFCAAIDEAKSDFLRDGFPEDGKLPPLPRVEGARNPVNNAQSAETVSISVMDWNTRIKPDVRLPGDERIVPEPAVNNGILDDEHVVLQQRVIAEGLRTGCFGKPYAVSRLEPLSRRRQHGDKRDRHLKDRRRHPDQIVKAPLVLCIEHPCAGYSKQPLRFISG